MDPVECRERGGECGCGLHVNTLPALYYIGGAQAYEAVAINLRSGLPVDAAIRAAEEAARELRRIAGRIDPTYAKEGCDE